MPTGSAGPSGTTIGMLGVGAMGRPIAERLLAAGHPVMICDRRSDALRPFEGRARVTAAAREVGAEADIVFGCLVRPGQYNDAVLGPDGIAAGGRVRHYVHLGTSGLPLVRELEAALRDCGIDMLDAPVTGGPGRAARGELTAMVAGAQPSFDVAVPLIRPYANHIVHMGAALGAAQWMKLVNNAMTLGNLAVAAEAMTAGARAGIPADIMLSVLTSGSAQSNVLTAKIADYVLTGRYAFGGTLDLVIKDLELYLGGLRSLGLEPSIATAVTTAYCTAAELGNGNQDMTRVVHTFEAWAEARLGPAVEAPPD